MVVDWALVIGIGRDVLTGLSAVGAVIVGALGLKTWRKQLKGTTEYELARRCLRAVYEVRDQIAVVRSPFMSAGEINAAFDEAGIEDKEDPSDPRTDRLVYNERWKRLSDAMSDLEVEALEAEVLWGDEARAFLSTLKKRAAELYVAILQHVRRKEDRHWWETADPEDVEKNDRVIFMLSNDPDKDEFTGKVHEAVAQAESVLRPHLRL